MIAGCHWTAPSIIFASATFTASNAVRRAAVFPEHEPEGWQKNPVDPCILLATFPALRLRPAILCAAFLPKRWAGPKSLRQTFHEWALHSIPHSQWARE